jgi:hypothetical protein
LEFVTGKVTISLPVLSARLLGRFLVAFLAAFLAFLAESAAFLNCGST